MIAALKQDCELRVISDASAAAKVGAKLPRPKKGAYKTPLPVPDLQPNVDFGLRPIEMLLELGAATTPSLPDQFRLSRRWGLLRYGWALATASSPLDPFRLSSYAMGVRYHHKTLQSEDLGVGLACWVTRELLAARNPGASILVVDGEQALHKKALVVPGVGSLPLSTTGKMPDYFCVAYDPTTSSMLEVVVLECKGTHGEAHVFTQLADAMHQLDAVTVGGWPAASLAMGSLLNDRRIRVYAIDPEGSPLSGDVAPREARARLRVEVRESGQLEVTDPPAFRRRLLDVAAAQMLNWAGFTGAADARLGEGSTGGERRPPPEVRETEAGEFAGLSCRLPITRDTTYEVFFGLDRRVASALIADQPEDELAALAAMREQTDRVRIRRPDNPPDVVHDRRDRPSEAILGDSPEGMRRSGLGHVTLDDPGDPTVVRNATPEGLYLEVRATSGAE